MIASGGMLTRAAGRRVSHFRSLRRDDAPLRATSTSIRDQLRRAGTEVHTRLRLRSDPSATRRFSALRFLPSTDPCGSRSRRSAPRMFDLVFPPIRTAGESGPGSGFRRHLASPHRTDPRTGSASTFGIAAVFCDPSASARRPSLRTAGDRDTAVPPLAPPKRNTASERHKPLKVIRFPEVSVAACRTEAVTICESRK